MARVNITVPDELLARAREHGLNVSKAAVAGLTEELDRIARLEGLDRYLRELDDELGPISPQEAARAREWADRILGSEEADPKSGTRSA